MTRIHSLQCENSSFLITINTNKVDDTKHSLKTKLDKTINEFLNNLGAFLVFRGIYETPKIYNIKAEYAIETGPKLHRVHSHILLVVSHSLKVKKDKIEMNLPNIKKFLVKRMGFNLHSNCRFTQDNLRYLSNYVEKNFE